MFSREELDFLFECVEAKEHDGSLGELMGDMLGAVFCRSDEERKKMADEGKKRKAEAAAKQRVIRERCILMKAKIIGVRDAADAGAFLAGASSGQL